jgi:UPF0755 protein
VFFNRLTDATFLPPKMLQSDPTAAYGCIFEPDESDACAAYEGKVTARMVRDRNNRYNTYRHPGLPPGPICSPGLDALIAVLEPEEHDYLFFVADGRGGHIFSRSFAEHEAAIQHQRRR